MFGKNNKKMREFSTYRKKSSTWQWVLAGGVLVVFAVIIGYAYSNKESLENGETPLITAQKTPIKTRAEEPGGMEIPNQDKQVFDLLERVDAEKFNNKLPEKVKTPSIIEDIASPQKAEVKITEPQEEVKKPVYQPQKQYSGDFGVQLASFANLQDAKNAMAKFFTNYYSQLSNLEQDIQKAVVHGKGYYRVRFLGLNTKAEAASLCDKLKQKGQSCLAIQK